MSNKEDIPLTKKYLINGPNNVVRLTNGKKILYIFGFYNKDVSNQTECINYNYNSIDIDKFLLLFIRNNRNIKLDIFIHLDKNSYLEMENNNYDNKNNYLLNCRKLLNKTIKNIFSNIRFHYIDIRSYLSLYDVISNYYDNYIFNNNYIYKKYIFLLNELKFLIIEFIKLLKKNKIINKILDKYNDLNIKKIINKIYKIILINTNNIINNINKLIKLISVNYIDKNINIIPITFMSNTLNKLDKKLNIISDKIYNDILLLGTSLKDLYFIRRFIDKKYINNSILITPFASMINIIYILIKYFNYKITHIDNLNKSININKYMLKLSFKFENINNLLDIFCKKRNDFIYQCTNLIDFPVNFS